MDKLFSNVRLGFCLLHVLKNRKKIKKNEIFA